MENGIPTANVHHRQSSHPLKTYSRRSVQRIEDLPSSHPDFAAQPPVTEDRKIKPLFEIHMPSSGFKKRVLSPELEIPTYRKRKGHGDAMEKHQQCFTVSNNVAPLANLPRCSWQAVEHPPRFVPTTYLFPIIKNPDYAASDSAISSPSLPSPAWKCTLSPDEVEVVDTLAQGLRMSPVRH